jgi:type I restriction enzyme M protein
MTSQITREQLNAKLWTAADILRGSIDSSDYKSYIFGFLFLKRLSDRFEEEAEMIVKRERKAGATEAESQAIAYEDPDEHPFFVPQQARWSEIRKVSENLGETLNVACAALEEANGSKFEGVLLGIDFNDSRRLGGDQKAIDVVLNKLVQHFSSIPLRNADLAEGDMLGRAYEYLIEKFADDAGKKGGEFYTPHQVVEVVAKLLAPREAMRICDPTCGSGGMLIECARLIEEAGGNPRNLSLFGQEKNLGTWGICKMNMLMHGLIDARIEKGDTIRDPRLLESGELMLFDRVIANPPFSLDQWGYEEAEKDKFGRFRYGIPPKTKGDLAFVQHMIATVNGNGMVGVVMPHGVLFRGGKEGVIRQGFLEDDLLEAVVGLAPNLFYGTGIPAAILIFNRNKPRERRGKVLFIHAAAEFEAGKNQNFLRERHIKKIVEAYREFAPVEKFASVVEIDAIRANDFNLNISRYVDIADEVEQLDVAVELQKLRVAEKTRTESEAKMNRLLAELGFGAQVDVEEVG